jgi:phosphoglucomutase
MNDRLSKLPLDQTVKERVETWLSPEFDEATRREILGLIDAGKDKELLDRFYRDLEFGTGGLRGVMEAGTNRMNRYTVAMATQGLANYILQQEGPKSVVIAHDSRHNSEVFAEQAALVLAAAGIRAYLFRGLRPTPELSFAVRLLQTTAGIVLTASHNPREYNGYKVAWSDGAQIIAPHDKLIVQEVRKIRSLAEVRSLPKAEAVRQGLLKYVGPAIDRDYLRRVKGLSVDPSVIRRTAGRLKIVYTPLHGAGYRLVPRSLRNFGFRKIYLVKEQARPDGDFPTAPYPNPEEPESLKLGLALCRKMKADLLLATDPDSDRLGIAVRDAKTGDYVLLNGNQLGSVLSYYILSAMKQNGTLPPNGCLVKTIVTTDLAGNIARHFGVRLFDVFTGFKYIASVIREHPECKYIFGFEESYGFLPGDFVRDKDGVSAACLTAEVAAFAMSTGRTILDLLDEVYAKFGFFQDKLKSLTFKGKEGMERIQRIMARMTSAPIAEIDGHKLVRFIDYQKQKEFAMPGMTETAWSYDLPKADVLGLYFEGDLKITIRPSGTEPKIKYYFSIRRDLPAGKDLQSLKAETRAYLDKLEKAFTDQVMAIP